MVDAGVMWTALGTLVSGLGVAVGWRQLKAGGADAPTKLGRSRLDVHGLSVLPPTGRLPVKVRGRDTLLRELVKLVHRPPGEFVVLSGMGGVGKSTVAAAVAARVRDGQTRWRRRVDVWWVSVADPSSLVSAMVTVAQHLGASDADVELIATGQAAAADRIWALLDRARHRWLLVLDNADDPEVLARPAAAAATSAAPPASPVPVAVGAGDGWLRPTRRGLIVVTSRDASSRTWGRHARVIAIDPLDERDAARVLMDSAPAAGSEADARRLAERLGRLPLALGVAGSYLESDVALKTSFAEYQRSLDDASDLLAAEPSVAGPRAAVMETWELSLDALALRGVPQARGLLRLLSCYAPSTPIPLDFLDPEGLLALLAVHQGTLAATAERDLGIGLRHLRRLRMIDASPLTSRGERAVAVHPVIADANRAHLTAEPPNDLDPGLVRRTAVDLLTAAIDRLDCDTPADWPRYRLLAPHVHALFQTVAPHLDAEHLRALVWSTTRAAEAHDRSGAVQTGDRLCRATFASLAVLGDDDPACLYLRHIFAWETAIQGRPAEAEAIYRDVFARRLRVLGEDHVDTLWSHHELAWVSALQERWGEAESIYEDVRSRRARVLGPDHLHTLMTRHELAWTVASQGRGEEAEEALHAIIEARSRLLGQDHPRTLASRHELAWAIATQGRWSHAERAYRATLAARHLVLGEDHPDAVTTRHELAWTLAMQGRHSEAFAAYDWTLATRRRVLGPDHPDTVSTRQAIEALRSGTVIPAHHIV